MGNLPKLIDNVRTNLGDVLKRIAPDFQELSIATGYWDILGTEKIIEQIGNYKRIRLLIGQEPLSYSYENKMQDSKDCPCFPGKYFQNDLERTNLLDLRDSLRETTTKLTKMIKEGRLEVRLFKRTRLHAKAYIFGNYSSTNSIGIVGSSNFTGAGLTTNTELNSLESDFRIVNFQPQTPDQENGYLSWFDSLWNDAENVEWTGEFQDLLQNSPLGNLCYGPYDVYIKTLMEVFPEEILQPSTLPNEINDALYSFQNRNAGILINKLEQYGIAILADSVGLGKTITAGAVIKHYLDKSDGKANILVIAPAALKQQWKDDLGNILNIDYLTDHAFDIISEQDSNAIEQYYEEYEKEWRKKKNIDLFVIDEAHNLRSSSGRRHDIILKLLQQHPDSHILLLTATPVNNSLLDLANIIQLASKGKLTSINVSYPRPDGGQSEYIDFFEALNRIQSQIKKAEKNGNSIDNILAKYKRTIHEGLRHYLVRSTRQGVEAEGGIIDKKTGRKISFPNSVVKSISYSYNSNITDKLFDSIGEHIFDVFEGIDPRRLNLQLMTEFTQQTCHPLDFLNEVLLNNNSLKTRFGINCDVLPSSNLLMANPMCSLIPNVLQMVFTLGFTPYRPDVYQNQYYGKTIEEIREFKDIPTDIKIQFSVHNILQITWLKRLESSAAALLYSVSNYSKRITLFEKYLNKGFIVKLLDANLLESDYNDGEDIDQAFDDYDQYLADKEKIIDAGGDASKLIKEGVEKIPADPSVYNIKQINADLSREKKILSLLNDVLKEIIKPINDTKAKHLHDEIASVLSSKKYGGKVLIFSFFADTIKYLSDNANYLFGDLSQDFLSKAAFISGQSKETEEIIQRFSPKSKHYVLKEGEKEIDFLFSTDILSEGQNLQDAGFLVNYDLHWNPVRMIQRNGRINRLGSSYSEVLVENMKPMNELDMYLNLVQRLERKVSTIRNTIGLDQGVLSSNDVNPIEFIEKYYSTGSLPSEEDSLLAQADENIINFRKFLADNPLGSKEFDRIKDMPLGKWNYLSLKSSFQHDALGLIKVEMTTAVSQKDTSSIFFVDVSENESGENVATYIDSSMALEYIKADKDDNLRKIDNIKLNRLMISRRAIGEAKRQATNPTKNYRMTSQYVAALNVLSPYLFKNNDQVDLQGIIEKGVKTIDVKKDLEKILRKVILESKKTGSLFASTIESFVKIFKIIQNNQLEEKIATGAIGVLYYAKQ
jgi:ERCC4-related helicase